MNYPQPKMEEYKEGELIVIQEGTRIIEKEQFSFNTTVRKVIIPSSVTEIGELAFYGCSGLTSIETDAANAAYCSVDGVLFNKYKTEILVCPAGRTGVYNIPASVKSIGMRAFWDCCNLTSIETDAANAAYCSVDGVLFNKDKTEILVCPAGRTGAYDIPSSVKSIEDDAFRNCSGLTAVTIPNSIKSIGVRAFYGCSGLTAVTIPNSVTSIGDGAFCACSGLTSVTIPNSVTSIGIYAFNNCSGLTSVTIPGSVMSIGDSAFSNCSGLTAVTIPNSVTSIEDGAFEGCSSLTAVTIPNSVTNIGFRAFFGCSSLHSIYIPLGSKERFEKMLEIEFADKLKEIDI